MERMQLATLCHGCLRLSAFPSVVQICLCLMYVSLCLSMFLLIYLSTHIQANIHHTDTGSHPLPICISVYLSNDLPVYPSHLSIYLFLYLYLPISLVHTFGLLHRVLVSGMPCPASCAFAEARLESLYKLRHVSREWQKGLKGFEWLTTDEMKALGWPEILGCSGSLSIYTCVCIYIYVHIHEYN